MNVGVEEHSGARHFVVATDCDEKTFINNHDVRIWGIKNSFRFGKGFGPLNSYFLHDVDKEIIVKRSVINHCFDIFQKHWPIVQLRLLVDQSLSFVPLIAGVTEMYLGGSEINVAYASTHYPNLNCLRIGGVCEYEARFSGINNLRCDRTDAEANSVLHSFTGSFLYLFDTAEYRAEDLLAFCWKWKNNKLCQNLKFLHIQLDEFTEFFDVNRFLEEFEQQEWDPTVQPKNIEVPFMLDSHDFPKDILDNEFVYFQRAFDGKWASLSVQLNDFFFIVWD
ncbi:unnamed protein product [Caenorhabditis brenneri]